MPETPAAEGPIAATSSNTLPETGAPSPAEVLIPASEAAPPRDGGKKAIIIVGNHKWEKPVPRGTIVIVTEGRTYERNAKDEIVGAKVKTDGYPTEADLYFRTEPGVSFPHSVEATRIITLGDNVLQGNFWGFTPNPQFVHVGPAHPAYAAANLAWQRGADKITIVGLEKHEQERLQPYFDGLATDIIAPAPGVTVTFA